MSISRRSFLKAAALGAMPVPRVLLDAAALVPPGGGRDALVVLQLSGGNDGLNTVVPYESDVYHRSRPVLALPKGEVLRLEGAGEPALGLHPSLASLRELYDAGRVAVVAGVGYPNPSRSHFRSMDIWHTARPSDPAAQVGWLGRVVERGVGSTVDGAAGALHIGDADLPLALHGGVPVPSLHSIDFIDFLAGTEGRRMRRLVKSLHETPREDRRLETLRRLAAGTLAQVDTVLEIRERPVPVEYPGSELARRLRLAGQLIAGGFPARIFYLSQGGYDTHAQQKETHARLLAELGDALGAFFRHLDAAGASHRVAVLCFSEFSRRVAENGSLGTDHGIAAPVFVMSGRARGGIHGAYPSLDDLEDGDLRHSTDFRSVYATLLEDVLDVPHAPVLGGTFEKLELLERPRRF